jgi:hypothetical protein
MDTKTDTITETPTRQTLGAPSRSGPNSRMYSKQIERLNNFWPSGN